MLWFWMPSCDGWERVRRRKDGLISIIDVDLRRLLLIVLLTRVVVVGHCTEAVWLG